MAEKIRVRIAPSPTGKFHIGTARAALFNYLYTKKNKGSFVLRIEDTDVKRSSKEFEQDILEGLKWLGLEWDEGPEKEGDFGPYRQSERSDIYKKYIEKLLKEGKAYHCFCPFEELEARREYQASIGQPTVYSGKCRELTQEEVEKNIAEGKPYILRFKTPLKTVSFEDEVRGKIEFDSSLIGDFSLAKGKDAPLYNLAVVIDDYEMGISHVIRGEDHISNTPKQILLQEALGFPQPKYAHLPLVLGTDKSKLSKRHGAVSLSEYRDQGYLPESMINFLALLGWNPGTEKDTFSLKELTEDFSLEKVQKGGAVFNIKKLDYLNGFYIRQKPLKKLAEMCIPYLISAGLITPEHEIQKTVPRMEFMGSSGVELSKFFKVNETGKEIGMEVIEKAVSLYQERLRVLSEIPDLIDFFFKEKLDFPKELLFWKQMTPFEIYDSLEWTEKVLEKIPLKDFKKETLEKELIPMAQEMGDRGKLLWPLRAALTGKKASAGPFEVAELLGKEKTVKRIQEAKELLK